jgi:hypothetical protein
MCGERGARVLLRGMAVKCGQSESTRHTPKSSSDTAAAMAPATPAILSVSVGDSLVAVLVGGCTTLSNFPAKSGQPTSLMNTTTTIRARDDRSNHMFPCRDFTPFHAGSACPTSELLLP